MLHGGPSCLLSQQVVDYMLGEPLNTLEIPIDAIVTSEIKMVASAMKEATDDVQLAEIPALFPTLKTAGISLPLTCANIPRIVQQLAIHDVILKRVGPIQAIQDGMNEVGIIDLAKSYPGLMKTTLTMKEKILDADLFLSLVPIPGNMTNENKQVMDYFCEFLHSASEKELQDCLQFITGTSSVPPLGFPYPISLTFTPEKRLPFARTCSLQLELSTVYATFIQFKDVLKTAIYEHGGFHCE